MILSYVLPALNYVGNLAIKSVESYTFSAVIYLIIVFAVFVIVMIICLIIAIFFIMNKLKEESFKNKILIMLIPYIELERIKK